jgi:hypothetical protein
MQSTLWYYMEGSGVMVQLVDLRDLEKRAFRRFYDDGLFDVFFGLLILGLSLGSVVQDRLGSEVVALSVMTGVAAVLVVALTALRRRLVRPRLGEFTPGPARRRKITTTRLILIGSAVFGVVAFGLGVVAGRQNAAPMAVEVVLPLVWFVNAVAVLGAMAYLLDVPRFAVYGVLFGLVGPLLIWPDVLWDFRVPPVTAFALPALPMLGVGLWRLRRFLEEHPVRPTGEDSDRGRSP